MSAPVIAGAEPYSASGDTRARWCCTASPATRSPCAAWRVALADAGFTVELPLLPGHGTAMEDMVDTRWKDWSRVAEQAYAELAARTDSVVVVGLSMGGSLSVWLAEHHPEIAALSLVNPLLVPPDADTVAFVQAMIDAGDQVAPGIGSDIALEGAVESAYPGMPLQAALSLFEGVAEVEALLGQVRCPVLVFTSTQDHVVDPAVQRAPGGAGHGPGRPGRPGAELPRGHAGLREGRD